MSQVTGYPGGGITLGKNRVRLLTGVGNPNSSATPDVQSAGIGSLYLQTDVAGIWLCTADAAFNDGALNTAATWTQVSVP
jgi:hypothetical protein